MQSSGNHWQRCVNQHESLLKAVKTAVHVFYFVYFVSSLMSIKTCHTETNPESWLYKMPYFLPVSIHHNAWHGVDLQFNNINNAFNHSQRNISIRSIKELQKLLSVTRILFRSGGPDDALMMQDEYYQNCITSPYHTCQSVSSSACQYEQEPGQS